MRLPWQALRQPSTRFSCAPLHWFYRHTEVRSPGSIPCFFCRTIRQGFTMAVFIEHIKINIATNKSPFMISASDDCSLGTRKVNGVWVRLPRMLLTVISTMESESISAYSSFYEVYPVVQFWLSAFCLDKVRFGKLIMPPMAIPCNAWNSSIGKYFLLISFYAELVSGIFFFIN